MQFVDEQRTPEGRRLSKVDNQHALDTAESRVVAGGLLKVIDAAVGYTGHHIKGRVPQRQRHCQEQDRDMWLAPLSREDQVRDGHEDRENKRYLPSNVSAL